MSVIGVQMQLHPRAYILPGPNSRRTCILRHLLCIYRLCPCPVIPADLLSPQNYVSHLHNRMKELFSVLLLCAASTVLGEIVKVKWQSASSPAEVQPAIVASSSTSSVFSVPTPSSLPTVNSSEFDLSKHFCRLWRHQSKPMVKCWSCKTDRYSAGTYADGKIYIDGGNTVRLRTLVVGPCLELL
jgi:hypothetical protein